MPGSTLNTAQNIGSLTSFSINDSITSASLIDYYKFSLTATKDIQLLLSNVTENYLEAAIYIDKNNNGLIDSGEELYSNYSGSGRIGQIDTTLGSSTSLSAGNYYIGIKRLDGYNANSNYSLQITATVVAPSITPDPGKTLATAYNIGSISSTGSVTTTRTYQEFIGNADPIDYYKFSLTSTNDIKTMLNGTSQNYLDMDIYQDKNNNGLIEAGEQLYTDYAGDSRNGLIETTLGIGTYYMGVTRSDGYNNTNSSYVLQLLTTAAPPSIPIDPGNTLTTAYSIGSINSIGSVTTTRTYREFIGNVDPVDYYKFSLTGTNDIKANLIGVNQNYLDIDIYQDKNNNGLIEVGEQLYTDYAGDSRNGLIETTLGIGTYYMGVTRSDGYNNTNSSYVLQLLTTAVPPSIPIDPGNTLATAYSIGSINSIGSVTTTRTYQEFVGNVDPVDYYKFSLTGTNDVKMNLIGVNQNYLDMDIYQDKNNNGLIEVGEQLYTDYAGDSRNGLIETTLGIGTYYMGVTRSNGYNNTNSSYVLQLLTTAAPPSIPIDPGNSLATAYNIGNLVGINNFNEFVGNTDTIDYYRFSLAGTNSIQVLLSGVSQNYLDIAIYQDANSNGLIDDGELLDPTSYAGSGSNGQIDKTLGAGVYYISVDRSSGYDNTNSKYSLRLVNNTVPAPANNIALLASFNTVAEDGSNHLIYTFTRTGSSASALTVRYTAAGTATFGTDYTAVGVTNFNGTSGTVTFAAGSNTATLTLAPKSDATIESNETIALTIAAGSGYTIGTTTAVTGTITNDDILNRPGVSISVNDVTVVEGKDGNALLTVSLSGISNQPISVNYTTTAIGATAGADYVTKTGTLLIPPNSLTGTISIPIINDSLNEVDESFLVTLSSPINATINPSAGIAEVTITDTMKSAITRVLPSGVENLILIGAGAINGIGNVGGNRIVGNFGNNQINGGAGADTLSGASGSDTFVFQFGQSLASAPDRITDFTIGVDKIDLLSLAGTAVNAPVLFSRAGDNTAITLSSLATQVFADANGALAGNQALGLNSATLVKVNVGAIAGTYLVINDNVAGFQANNDVLINMTGIIGTLPTVGTISANSFFV
jgi:hypothetical protein